MTEHTLSEQQVNLTLNKATANGTLALVGNTIPGQEVIFTEGAMALLESLCREFGAEVPTLLAKRKDRQARIDKGALPDFLPETRAIRDGAWKIRGIPNDLLDRRVEITGPVERKMVINALNANAKVFMADFEDSLAPSWQKVVEGQINLRDAVRGEIEYTAPETGKHYKLGPNPAVLICRVRGLHLKEKHVEFNQQSIPGGLFDFAMYFYHNYRQLLAKGSGPYFYIPKLESHIEARWWAKVFAFVEERFCLQAGTIKCTCLIETLPAVFEMDEILYELRSNIVALNCGRWDYIFSYIKTLKRHGDRVLPDRQAVTMDTPFLSAYSRLLIKTCHKRGALAMGGMAAFIPAKDPAQNEAVLQRVRKDKELEARNGHDGTWVAHPGLADTAMGIFNEYIGQDHQNQLHITRDVDAPILAAELLKTCDGERTEQGMRLNIRIALQYLEAWISGNGCVPIYGLMEDAATAEISRASIWQWIQHGKSLSNGKLVTKQLFKDMLVEELANVKKEVGSDRFTHGKFTQAAVLLEDITTSDELVDFLTLPGYEMLTA
ncbi:malate synthase A [Shewanella oneidensis MR-1]|uniref:malate synthase n=1 Tax=Shewanella oneidensis (strain ATCC 700550 / JCM 31522 / CIP 106686 / LMG 19005 / NCIMB 14063 / MR-1) TaxID=211586 RepID=Q8EGV8_SHEON|nr:malate synthase A [Shewanella oneidensis]AAN54544.1 malate synthase A AceB [Shewanella oneidensis MR-1]MDX5996691.1 malate synthase A [Shewanella oneidensis]MEE2028073.1 Malate synthase A [Shewanella oneidensis]QKG96221.1 malate synthase A [Shewanella oneidensis MR-1]